MQLNINKQKTNPISTINILPKNKRKKRKGLSHTPKSFKHLHQSLRLKQIKSLVTEKEAKKKANQTSRDLKLNKDIPIYEIVLHDITHDISNSVKYIIEKFKHLNEKQNNALIYKLENEFKTVFFTH